MATHPFAARFAAEEADRNFFGPNRCDCGVEIAEASDSCEACEEAGAPSTHRAFTERQQLNNALATYACRNGARLDYADGPTGGWYVYDADTYDGEPINLSASPVEALLDWHSSSPTPSPAPELMPGTQEALANLTIRTEGKDQ